MTNIPRRDFIKGIGLGAASLALPWNILADTPAAAKRPNIILVMADDLSARELGCYGHGQHRTPVLDGLAQSGVQFRTCWATPLCSPTRAELLTGRYGFRTGWYHNDVKSGNLAENNETFATLLRSSGYKTAICGKWQLPGTYEEHGFDEHCLWLGTTNALRPGWQYDGPVEKDGMTLPNRLARYWHPAIARNGEFLQTTATDYGPDIFVDFMLDFAKRHRQAPFLIYYPMCLPHTSWDFDAGRDGYLPVPELDKDGNKTGRKVKGSLKSNVEYIDALFGRIVKGLDALKLREETVIMFTGDNGTAGYGKNRTVQERGPRVPLIVNGLGTVKAQGALDTLVDLSDILPTMCELGGTKIPVGHTLDGQSFAHTLRGDQGREREWIFSYLADRRFLRDKRWLSDGNGRFYDCGNHRDEQGYKDVTASDGPEVVAARQRFANILESLPPPPEELIEKARQAGKRFLPPKR